MLPWIQLDTAPLPGEGELRLKQRGSEFSIMLGANELMNSRLSGSEEAMATLAAERLNGRAKPSILIGGLGMGFTLRAALEAFGQDASIEVAELVPAVESWARGPLAALFAGSLDDPRVTVTLKDAFELISGRRSTYDAILLDVDNGPEGLTVSSNDRLYDTAGLHHAKTALKPGGLLAVWSAAPDKRFGKRLHDAGFKIEEVTVRARRGGGGARHRVWLARP